MDGQLSHRTNGRSASFGCCDTQWVSFRTFPSSALLSTIWCVYQSGRCGNPGSGWKIVLRRAIHTADEHAWLFINADKHNISGGIPIISVPLGALITRLKGREHLWKTIGNSLFTVTKWEYVLKFIFWTFFRTKTRIFWVWAHKNRYTQRNPMVQWSFRHAIFHPTCIHLLTRYVR